MKRITDADLRDENGFHLGVKGQDDIPGLTTQEMQHKVEEIARDVIIPAINENVEIFETFETRVVEDLHLHVTDNVRHITVSDRERWDNPTSGGKRYATIIIGTASAGHTANDVDILLGNDRMANSQLLNSAFSNLPVGGKVIFREGRYLLNNLLSGRSSIIEGMGREGIGGGRGTFLDMNGRFDSVAAVKDLTITSDSGTTAITGAHFENCTINGLLLQAGILENIVWENNIINGWAGGVLTIRNSKIIGNTFNTNITLPSIDNIISNNRFTNVTLSGAYNMVANNRFTTLLLANNSHSNIITGNRGSDIGFTGNTWQNIVIGNRGSVMDAPSNTIALNT